MKDLFPIDFKGLLRGLAFSILGAALVICLFFIAYGLVFNFVTSKPEKVKKILEKSSLYSDLPPVLYDQIAQEGDNSPLEIPLKDPGVRRIALEVYDPSFARASIENLIDGLYNWLDGTSQEPQISINLAGQNKEFGTKLGKYARKKVAGLPPCSLEERNNLNEVNVFKTKCWPADISPKTAGKEVEKVIAGADDSALNAHITAQDLKTAEGEPIHESFSGLPNSFSTAKTLSYAFIIMALVIIAVIYYASGDKISALRRVSHWLLLAGVLMALMPFIFIFSMNLLLNNLSSDEQTVNIVRTILEQFMREADKIYYLTGAVLILIAGGLYFYSRKVQSDTDKLHKKKS